MHPRLTIQSVLEQPNAESLHLYPDFIIASLLREGVGRIEADYTSAESEPVPFIFKTRDGSIQKTIFTIGRGYFRSVLARMAGRCNVDNLYGGHAVFTCNHDLEEKAKTHWFSLFVCNERKMGYWLKLYLCLSDEAESSKDKSL